MKDNQPCVWQTGTPCDGNIEERELFDHRLTVSICDRHFDEHKDITTLCTVGKINAETALAMTPDQRKQKIQELIVSGLDISEVVY